MKDSVVGIIIGVLMLITLLSFFDEPQVSNDIPSLQDIQRRLGVKADGKYGPETQEAWDKACGNQYGVKYQLQAEGE